jgi:PAS domain S-box-containing protein
MKQLHKQRERSAAPVAPPEEPHLLGDELTRVRARMTALFERYEDHSRIDPDLAESLSELQNAVEELQVAQHELHEQHQRVREAWSAMHVERIRYLSLFHVLPDAYFITTARGQIREANEAAARMLNRSVEQLLGKPLAVYIPTAERERFRTNHSHCLATGASLTWETTLEPRGRAHIPVEFRLSISMSDPQGSARLYWLIRDIRERREAERKLVQAERMAAMGEMVAGLAHESRNALQRSQACLSMLRLEVPDNPEAQDLLDRLRSAQQRLVHLYDQVRLFSAPAQVQSEPVNLIELLQQAMADLLFVHQGRVLRLMLVGNEADPPIALVDRVGMSQVFMNIIENSVAACPDPVVVDFDWFELNDGGKRTLQLRMRDNGPGLADEAAQRIFEPFFTTKVRGTGLGMSIVRRVIEGHGGTITVGRLDGPGTELIISLPK